MPMCNFVLRGICLTTFSHDAVHILASPESIAGGAPNCKTGEFDYFWVVKSSKIDILQPPPPSNQIELRYLKKILDSIIF